jgi:hypothetical protein
MSLPTLNNPTYELVVPSSKKKIKYRPFVVKEEKILLMALETEDEIQIANAIKDIISTCVSTKGFDVEDLATFDIEYLFLNIRAKSVGEVIELILTCPDDNETQVRVNINIDDISVEFDKNHTNQIKLSEDLWVEMKYPGIDMFATSQENIDDTFTLVAKSISKIYNSEDVWDETTTSEKEFIAFVENMNSKQFNEMQKFFDSMPALKHTVEITNPKTKVTSEYTIEGLSNFFA